MSQVLVVEDDKSIAEPLQKALELNNITVDVVNNCEDGWELIKQNTYEIIILDLRMPNGMQGEELLYKIRKECPFVDVLIFSCTKEFEDVRSLVNIGIDGFYNKSTADLNDIIKKVKEKIEPLDEDEVNVMFKEISKIRGDKV